ncbi:hypothetical protein [Alteromonas sp. D210916BOD_24]|uniref:hypothetical protein n=1 Tax=Alteromonas sp. D210916BOD_24 TaxID=3157618 RepID=UPI00399D1DFD
MSSKYSIKQQLSYAMIMLLFTCLLALKQGYKPISDIHHFDVSVTEFALEFEVEESASDDPFTPSNIEVAQAQFVLCQTLLQTPYSHVCHSHSFATPLTRAPPTA